MRHYGIRNRQEVPDVDFPSQRAKVSVTPIILASNDYFDITCILKRLSSSEHILKFL